MSKLDWVVLLSTLITIVVYGVWRTRGTKNIEGYLLGDKNMKWWTIGLSIMATQASAITFLSTPGQAYEDGMRFVQFYFGLPIAMVILSVTVIPVYYRLKVYTAYEYLESRFDLKTRSLAAFLFLIQRGLAAGITIYAPSIILSTILGWSLNFTVIFIGALVIIYTVSGGTKAVSVTHKQQMFVIFAGLFIAFFILISLLPENISFNDAVNVAGKMNKLNVVDFSLDFSDRYNFWSGLTGGLFLALSYFGTDQSQVQRYLSGKSITESRLGLIFNGILKIPMQFMILFIGAMVFVFYQFQKPPVFFNETAKSAVYTSIYASEMHELEQQHDEIFNLKKNEILEMVSSMKANDDDGIATRKKNIEKYQQDAKQVKKQVASLVQKASQKPEKEVKDTDYVFITFIVNYLPHGIIGLLLAVIFSAAMSSTSAELNALASTTTIDMYKRSMMKNKSEKHYLNASKLITVGWGIVAILFAATASLFENLIEAVNILGSIFYGTILGIFMVAFYFKYIKSNAVFIAALVAEAIVIVCYLTTNIGFLWYNVIGCAIVLVVSYILQFAFEFTKERA
ncbi:MAG: sodium:solute symporter [Bacteroidota bacterium]|nr:sodium:solute symporter [Bacteroidota bacterium]